MPTLLFNLIVIVENTSTAVTAGVTTINIDMIVKLKLVDFCLFYLMYMYIYIIVIYFM